MMILRYDLYENIIDNQQEKDDAISITIRSSYETHGRSRRIEKGAVTIQILETWSCDI